MDTRERLILLKENTDYNWREFAAYFDIPYRTVQDWYLGKRRMPDYLLRLMWYKMQMENVVSETADDDGGKHVAIGKD